MKNVELKVRIDNFGGVISLLKKLQAKHVGRLLQIDTYYNCSNGRLKIRETKNRASQLVFYKRPDKIGSKTSYYLTNNIERKQTAGLKLILAEALGEKVVVKKERDLWLYKNTRIHLDKVKSLGNFLELETMVEKAGHNAKKEHNEIIDLLNLSKYKTHAKSYSDMLISQ
jgi:predicted adenylyl cyclase CyaB